MVSLNPPQCPYCDNFKRERFEFWRCKAFPEGIPDELAMSVVMHDKPYPGDNGIRFEKYVGNLNMDGEIVR
jgi:hypothetical protein